MRLIDLTGHRFGRLTVLSRSGTRRRADGKGTVPVWLCRCDCGSEVERRGSSLRSGATESCGCLRTERQSQAKRTDEPGYSPLHKRAKADLGAASGFLCVDCGAEAQHWAWSHTITDHTRWADDGRGYSLNLEEYAPMCAKCHKRFDLEAAAQLRPHRDLHQRAAERLGLTQNQYRKLLRQNQREAVAILAGWVPVFDPDKLEGVGADAITI